ncbi:MAG: hypothetical protein QOH57_805 [Mycobacterium sp.]|nr:hypothetical protein [Mycobacterium sp.]
MRSWLLRPAVGVLLTSGRLGVLPFQRLAELPLGVVFFCAFFHLVGCHVHRLTRYRTPGGIP